MARKKKKQKLPKDPINRPWPSEQRTPSTCHDILQLHITSWIF
jgi:hypothetical protein